MTRLFAALIAVAFTTAAQAADKPAASPCPNGQCPVQKSVTIAKSRTSVAAAPVVLAPATPVRSTVQRVYGHRPHVLRKFEAKRPHLLLRLRHGR